MKRIIGLTLVLLFAAGLNYLLASAACKLQPVLFFADAPTPATDALQTRLVAERPAVADCLIPPHVFEATTGLGRRVVGVIGFDESHFVTGDKATGRTVDFSYGPMITGSRDVETWDVHEDGPPAAGPRRCRLEVTNLLAGEALDGRMGTGGRWGQVQLSQDNGPASGSRLLIIDSN